MKRKKKNKEVWESFTAGLLRWLSGKESASQWKRHRDEGSISGSGRSPGAGHDNPLQYSCLQNPTDRGAWEATVYGVAESQTWLNAHTHTRDHWSWWPWIRKETILSPCEQDSAGASKGESSVEQTREQNQHSQASDQAQASMEAHKLLVAYHMP